MSYVIWNTWIDLQEKFRCDTLTEVDLVDLMKKFVEDTKNEVHEREGWPDSAYGVSKLGVTVLTRIDQCLSLLVSVTEFGPRPGVC